MDGIKKYAGSICKEGYYRFQTRSWFDLDRMRATANAEQCFALVEELRISGKHVLDDNFVCAKLDKLRILGGDDFVQMGMWYVNSTRHALVKAQSV